MGRILRRTYSIAKWVAWDDEIHYAVQDFRARFSLAPNILLASKVTHARIDMAARKKKLRDPNGEPAREGEYTPITIFTGPDYQLDFCVDEALPTGRFSLLWDDDPDGGDEEDVPDEDTEDVGGAGSESFSAAAAVAGQLQGVDAQAPYPAAAACSSSCIISTNSGGPSARAPLP